MGQGLMVQVHLETLPTVEALDLIYLETIIMMEVLAHLDQEVAMEDLDHMDLQVAMEDLDHMDL